MHHKVLQLGFVSRSLLLIMVIFGVLNSQIAYAGIIVSNTAGTTVGFGATFAGQSVTTPGGGPWNNIAFNFYSFIGGGSYASGTLYALSQAYSGTAANLSTSTAGYLASTSTISNNTWVFSNLTLNPNTQYFFYQGSASTAPLLQVSGSSVYGGGNLYVASSGFPNFSSQTGDANFQLQGDISAIPEPSSMMLTALATGALVYYRRRKLTSAKPDLQASSI